MKNTYLVWDLETSGLDPVNCDILEIGAVEVVDGEIVKRHSWLLNHEKPVPPEITAITGITDDLLFKEGKNPRWAIREFMLVMEKYDTHVTHNGIKFDVPFLCEAIKKFLNGATPDLVIEYHATLNQKMVDTAVICKARKIGMPRLADEPFVNWANRVMAVRAFGVKYNVGIMCDELGIDKSNVTQHRALGDVELTNEIYKKVALVTETIAAQPC